MIVGSKKKKGSRDNNKKSQGNSSTVRKAQPDMSKYAGAVSNKSKRNYSDLKLVRPDNLKEYASKSAPKRSNSSVKSAQVQRTEPVRKDAPPKRNPPSSKPNSDAPPRSHVRSSIGKTRKPKRPPRSTSNKQAVKYATTQQPSRKPEGHIGGLANMFGSLASSLSSIKFNAVNKNPSVKSSQKPLKKSNRSGSSGQASGTKKTPVVEYKQDEYSKALNNSDFYSSVVEKYYMKHPEELNKRERSGTSRKKRAPNKPMSSKSGKLPAPRRKKEKPQITDKSVAEIAVKGRGTENKKSRAKVVKSGHAKGVVTSRAAHRRVHQRNRRRTVVFNSVMVMATVVFLIAVYVNVFFNVKSIEINGESPYDIDQISSMCGFTKGDNILFIDANSSENKIIESLPYIETCTIKRRLPATVVVNITEASALGVAEISANQWAVLSSNGKVLELVTNSTVVSSSDVVTSLTYDPDVSSVNEVADKRDLPVLQGLSDISGVVVGSHVEGDAAEQISDFNVIATEASEFGMELTRISLGNKGYEMEYDGRINIVLGEITDRSTMKRRIETADYIVRVSGDITEHEHGEITYLKNEAFYSPTYETT